MGFSLREKEKSKLSRVFSIDGRREIATSLNGVVGRDDRGAGHHDRRQCVAERTSVKGSEREAENQHDADCRQPK